MRENDREFTEVDIEAYDLDSIQSVLKGVPIQNLVLRFTQARRFDIGALCYTERFKFLRAAVKFVEHKSLRVDRCVALQNLISTHITDFYTNSTNLTFYGNIIKSNAFFTWCDQNGYEDFLSCPRAYKVALRNYSHSLQVRKNNGEICKLTAGNLQSTARKIGYDFFPDCEENFYTDIPLISVAGSKKSTPVPTASDMANHLTLCETIFHELTKFLLGFHDFPYRMPLLCEYVWLLPTQYLFATKIIISNNKRRISNSIFWDYVNGRLRPFDECFLFTSQLRHHVVRQYTEAKRLLSDANADYYHTKRIRLGKLAHDAFASIFVANTAFNESQVRNLRWDNNYSIVNSTTHGFCEIKMRSGGKSISINVKKTFIKDLEEYLLLRNYLCAGTDWPYLFLGMTSYGSGVSGKLQTDAIAKFNERILTCVDPGFKGLGYRELRKYKSNYLLSKNHSVATVSAVMQTSRSTVLKNYSDAEENTAIDEISSMMRRLISAFEDYSGQQTPAGYCADSDNAGAEIIPPRGYEPNCKSFEGCIFCCNFKTHARAEDIKKLLSMRFIICEYMASCSDHDHFQNVHGAAITQIDRIIKELLNARPELAGLVKKISDEVTDNFELDPYWERQYQRLLKLKVMK